MKSKGFTLVELLAVIILIGLIAVITIPKIKDSLDDSKQKIAEASAVNYSKQIDKLVLEEKMKNNSILLDGDYNIDSNGKIYNEENEYVIDVSGKKPTGGTLTFSENDLQSGCITVNNYAITIENDEVTNVVKGNCEYQSIEENIIAIAQNYANNVKTVKGNVTNIFDVPIEGITNEKVTAGWISLVKGEIDSYSLKIGAYVVTFLNGNTTISKTTELAAITIANAEAQREYKISKLGELKDDGAKYLTDAIEVYFNPTKGTNGGLCESTEEGCMHWYLYSIKGNYANMILDHNIIENIPGASITDYQAGLTKKNSENYQIGEGEGSKAISAGVTYPDTVTSFPRAKAPYGNTARGPLTALNTLIDETNSWKTGTPLVPNASNTNEHIIPSSANNNKYQIDYTGYHARMLTKEEANNLNCTEEENTCPEWMIKATAGEDNTTYHGIFGYWTTSWPANVNAYYIRFENKCTTVYAAASLGIRPVITVDVNDVL